MLSKYNCGSFGKSWVIDLLFQMIVSGNTDNRFELYIYGLTKQYVHHPTCTVVHVETVQLSFMALWEIRYISNSIRLV